VKIEGEQPQAVIKAREALYIQSGAKNKIGLIENRIKSKVIRPYIIGQVSKDIKNIAYMALWTKDIIKTQSIGYSFKIDDFSTIGLKIAWGVSLTGEATCSWQL